ncbi:MAG: 16S rRNA (guanine(527)-N(7))-methyltransferase RsmG [Anaerolinea sp.]|nr:16S rRNA (guanine(527)-N(7))-methyltransferase RsmG [Anaerolinea sp.]
MWSDEAAGRFGVTLTPEQCVGFDLYAAELAVWNTHTNLTAITAPDEVRVRHFLDSLSVVNAVPMRPGLRVIDVGTGAGFPGLPLKLAFPDIHMTLVDATGKKIAFLAHMAELLHLKNETLELVHARAEEIGHMAGQRATYDAVLARAVARLPSLLEYLLPLAKVGGVCIAMKGKTAHEEAADSKKALGVLGGKLREIIDIMLPGVEEPHHLVVVEKVKHTPNDYPRKPGTPTSKPLI